ncbi:hypothetical protein NIES23_16780 [Trichormus variabilis NIES-23]|uniref:Uncharacterized protein n=1 Tax=Trichormus variabilis NIES-23 TaxID=1973479 RepID=A0A1Z4KIT2_ANAVA|nr:hypothetical protein NIES23_16780 [Trichormus variabilis NIES-23]
MSRTDLPQTANVPDILKCWYARYYILLSPIMDTLYRVHENFSI